MSVPISLQTRLESILIPDLKKVSLLLLFFVEHYDIENCFIRIAPQSSKKHLISDP